MGGLVSFGGLISGIDTNSLIAQLIQLERQPIIRLENRVRDLQTQQTAVRELRTQVTTFRDRLQDFRIFNLFDQFAATSSEETILGAEVSGENPVRGAFEIDVQALATATTAQSSAVLGGAINTSAVLNSAGINQEITAGNFTINGVQFTVDPATDSLDDILADINGSAAGVTATYDALTDTVSLENSTVGDTSLINLGATDDDSNLLTVLNVAGATQSTGVNGSTVVTSTRNLGAIDTAQTLSNTTFAAGAVTAGSFSINGISISVDPTTDTILDIIGAINDSDAQVSASYDTASDTIRFVSKTLGSRTINFGGAGDTSNFLTSTNLTAATQTAGADSQFTVNGGAVQTRNSNEVSDAIGGVTLNLLSIGTSTVNVDNDDDAIVEDIQEFVTEFNNTIGRIRDLTAQGGVLENDGSLRQIENFLRSTVFSTVSGFGEFSSLLNIGITTGEDFDATVAPTLSLDEEAFREALRGDRANVEDLFANTSQSGVADLLFEFVNEAVKATGFLNERSKAGGIITDQIDAFNGQIDRLEDRVAQREARLRREFLRAEQLLGQFQSQSSALGGLSVLSFR